MLLITRPALTLDLLLDREWLIMLPFLGVCGRELDEGVLLSFPRSSSSSRTDRETISGKYFGQTADNKGRIYGRQAQMMPTFASTTEKVAAGGLSNVGSGEFEMRTSDWSRMIDTRHTLMSS